MTDPMRLYNTLTRRKRSSRRRRAPSGCTPAASPSTPAGTSATSARSSRRRAAPRAAYQAGYEMRHVMNFTDVDDRTIAGVAEGRGAAARVHRPLHRRRSSRTPPRSASSRWRRRRAPPTRRTCGDGRDDPALEARGHTYRSDGSIYFKISTLPDYGKLARLDHEGIKAGARVDADKYDKEDARDFVLWKATKPGEPTWDFGIGPGRPGWHIECSAMALRLLGEPPIDIHAGGIDLIFPHHENEIAQSEGATGKPFARFWVHVEHLLIDDEPRRCRSRSATSTPAGHRRARLPASALRYLLLSSHYRKQLNFTWTAMAAGRGGAAPAHRLPRAARHAAGARPQHPDASRERLDEAARARSRGTRRRPEHRRRPRRDVRPGARAQHRDRRRGGRRAAMRRRSARRSSASTACSACCRCGGRGRARRCPSRRSSGSSRRAAPPACARNFAEADRIRDDLAAAASCSRTRPAGHALEAEVADHGQKQMARSGRPAVRGEPCPGS
jgi:hypothetical protein